MPLQSYFCPPIIRRDENGFHILVWDIMGKHPVGARERFANICSRGAWVAARLVQPEILSLARNNSGFVELMAGGITADSVITS